MSEAWADLLVLAMGAYLALGALIALLFVFLGAGRIDPAAQGMPLQARLIIWPGCTLLWPLILVKWLRGSGPPVA